MSAPATWSLQVPGNASSVVRLAVEWNSVSIRTPREEGRFSVLNRQNDVVVVGRRKGREISLPVIIMSQDDYNDLDALLASGETLLLSNTLGESIYVWPVSPHEVSLIPTGDQTTRPVRRMTVNFIEQDAP